MTIPYVGFTEENLAKMPRAYKGMLIPCARCGMEHPLELGTLDSVESELLGFYKCGEVYYLGSVAGRCVVGSKGDCSGEIDVEQGETNVPS